MLLSWKPTSATPLCAARLRFRLGTTFCVLERRLEIKHWLSIGFGLSRGIRAVQSKGLKIHFANWFTFVLTKILSMLVCTLVDRSEKTLNRAKTTKLICMSELLMIWTSSYLSNPDLEEVLVKSLHFSILPNCLSSVVGRRWREVMKFFWILSYVGRVTNMSSERSLQIKQIFFRQFFHSVELLHTSLLATVHQSCEILT